VHRHPFFNGLDWDTLRSQKAPFEPRLTGITDTSNFPQLDVPNTPLPKRDENLKAGNGDLAFVGYTYKRWETVKTML
jgi:protein-serine/threonine kinase